LGDRVAIDGDDHGFAVAGPAYQCRYLGAKFSNTNLVHPLNVVARPFVCTHMYSYPFDVCSLAF
jgi:hypothetical protein